LPKVCVPTAPAVVLLNCSAIWFLSYTNSARVVVALLESPDVEYVVTVSPFYDFDLAQLRNDAGLPVYLPANGNSQSEPYVYFRPNSKGEYHDAWKNCCPCRDSDVGGWIKPKSFQLSPGLSGKYGSGVQYPSGSDYDAERQGNMSSFMSGTILGDDMD
jgi:hypothetical protein